MSSNATPSDCLVVLSGGQDSTTCLYWALREFGENRVCSLSFDYGQRHRIELDSAAKIAEMAGIKNTILPINTLSVLGGNALTDDMEVTSELSAENSLPNTFVPGRNLIFLTYAAAFAYQHQIQHLVTGVAETDYSGYPDCREQTIRSLEKTINLGMESFISIHTPLMHLSKKQTVEFAIELQAMEALAYSHSCYQGLSPPCGECNACVLRARGFEEASVNDPLLERFS